MIIIIILILIILFILFYEKFEDDEKTYCVEARVFCKTSDCVCCSGVKPACSSDIKGKKTCQCLI